MRKRPRVAVGGLGGTIAMTQRQGGPGVEPRLEAAQLIDALPEIAERVEVSAATLASKPGASLTERDLLRALVWAEAQVQSGANGVVLVQGTDTLEESAYLLDLWWARPEPLVVTGAMRPPEQPGADGPANLVAAVATAISADARDRGVLVVMADEVHAAARVAKRDALATSAFESPGFGAIGRLLEGVPCFVSAPSRFTWLPAPDLASVSDPRVAVVVSHLGDNGRLLDLAADDGFDGVVLATHGVGHISAAAADVVEKVARRIPVVFSSRTGGGSTATATYGFAGSEADLLRRGALGAGWLSVPKARALLWALLHLGFDTADIAAGIELRSHLRETERVDEHTGFGK